MSSFVAFLSGADQYGRWVPEQEITASAYLGGSTVDFSQALFKYPVPWSEVEHRSRSPMVGVSWSYFFVLFWVYEMIVGEIGSWMFLGDWSWKNIEEQHHMNINLDSAYVKPCYSLFMLIHKFGMFHQPKDADRLPQRKDVSNMAIPNGSAAMVHESPCSWSHVPVRWFFPMFDGKVSKWIPSGKHTKNYGTPLFLTDESTINCNFQ